jgi:hypothetical protein
MVIKYGSDGIYWGIASVPCSVLYEVLRAVAAYALSLAGAAYILPARRENY